MGKLISVQYYPCNGYKKKCPVMLNDLTAKGGRLPELCPDCKKAKEKDDLKIRQLAFKLRKQSKQEMY